VIEPISSECSGSNPQSEAAPAEDGRESIAINSTLLRATFRSVRIETPWYCGHVPRAEVRRKKASNAAL